jgi:hypothetical protein
MTWWRSGEPTLADVQDEFPHWHCTRGNNGLYYAEHKATSQRVRGEDPLDLRDQIRAAETRNSYDDLLPVRTIPGPGRLLAGTGAPHR